MLSFEKWHIMAFLLENILILSLVIYCVLFCLPVRGHSYAWNAYTEANIKIVKVLSL